MTIQRCKYCKGSKCKISTRKDGKIEKELCIYCDGKGFIRTVENKNQITEKEVTKKENGVLE